MAKHDFYELATLLQNLARRVGADDIADAANDLVVPPIGRSGSWSDAKRLKARETTLAHHRAKRKALSIDSPASCESDSDDLTP